MRTETIRARTELAPFDRIVDTLGTPERQTQVLRASGVQYDSVLGRGGVFGRSQRLQATRGGLVHSPVDGVRVPSLPQRQYIPVVRAMPEA